MRVVVLGVGNVLMADEGVGVHVVQELGRRYEFAPEVQLIDGGTSGMEMLDDLARADRLIIVDAMKGGRAPGAIVTLTGDEVPVFFTRKLSPHQIALSDVLAALRVMDQAPGETVLIGVEPASLDLSMELSPRVAAAVPRVVDLVVTAVRVMGFAARERAPSATAAAG
jgi:hydrogenase maturation protease